MNVNGKGLEFAARIAEARAALVGANLQRLLWAWTPLVWPEDQERLYSLEKGRSGDLFLGGPCKGGTSPFLLYVVVMAFRRHLLLTSWRRVLHESGCHVVGGRDGLIEAYDLNQSPVRQPRGNEMCLAHTRLLAAAARCTGVLAEYVTLGARGRSSVRPFEPSTLYAVTRGEVDVALDSLPLKNRILSAFRRRQPLRCLEAEVPAGKTYYIRRVETHSGITEVDLADSADCGTTVETVTFPDVCPPAIELLLGRPLQTRTRLGRLPDVGRSASDWGRLCAVLRSKTGSASAAEMFLRCEQEALRLRLADELTGLPLDIAGPGPLVRDDVVGFSGGSPCYPYSQPNAHACTVRQADMATFADVPSRLRDRTAHRTAMSDAALVRVPAFKAGRGRALSFWGARPAAGKRAFFLAIDIFTKAGAWQ